jgi:DNA-binding NarL/FixJ family response regulator
MAKSRPPTDDATARLTPPKGFRSARLDYEGRAILVMSYDVPDWEFPAGLTTTEQAVLRAMLNGASQQEIATARGVSYRTVANQIASAYGKLGVGSRAEVAALLRRPRKPAAE